MKEIIIIIRVKVENVNMVDIKVLAKIVEVIPFVVMVDEKVIAKIVEVAPFVFMVDIKVLAKIVEVLSFVVMVNEKVIAKIVEVAPFVVMVDEKDIAKNVKIAHVTNTPVLSHHRTHVVSWFRQSILRKTKLATSSPTSPLLS